MAALQKWILRIFFPNKKGPPKKKWLEEAESLGKCSRLYIKRSGQTISAIEIAPPGASENFVVCVHPISRRGKYFFVGEADRIRPYVAAGFRVVLFDFNSFGESDRIDASLWRDVVETVKYIAKTKNPKSMIVHATSLGCSHTLRVINDLPYRSAVVLENPARSLMDYWGRWFITRQLLKLFLLLRLRFILEQDFPEIFESIDRKDVLVSFIVCEKDKITPPHQSKGLFKLGRMPKELFVFENLGHLEAVKDSEKYHSAIWSAIEWVLNGK